MRLFLCMFFLCFFAGCQNNSVYTVPTPTTVEVLPTPLSPPKVLLLSQDELLKLDNTSCGWGFRRMTPEPPEFTSAQIAMMEKYDCIYQGDATAPVLYLTFDEGYENGYTEKILDILAATDTPAAFFITGDYFKSARLLVDRMVQEGHIVGNHAMHHKNLPLACSNALEEEELLMLDRCFFKAYGIPMRYARPPEGEYSERALAMTSALGYRTTFWSFAYADWDRNAQKGADYAYQQVMKNLHNGCVLLLHAVSPDNAGALERIITDAKKMGYVFRSLDEYK